MATPGRSMVYSFLLFTVVLSLLEMNRGKLASSELFTILGGFISSLLFIVLLTFIGNFQESCGTRTGWGAVLLAETIALIAASTVHRVCITTCLCILLHSMAICSESLYPREFTQCMRCVCDIFLLWSRISAFMLMFVLYFPDSFLFSAGLLYEINKLSGMMLAKKRIQDKEALSDSTNSKALSGGLKSYDKPFSS